MMVTGNRRRDRFLDRPWVAITAVAGVLIVVAGTLVFFLGGSGGLSAGTAASHGSSGQGIPQPAGGTSGHNGSLVYNVVMTAGYERPDVMVPANGTFLRVMYRGGYAGTVMSGNSTLEVRDSGERVFAIENAGSSVSADLLKLDNSARQQMTVEIWKDGTRLLTNTTSLPYGEVTVTGSI